ncbi:AraC family transcriptional regulator [Kerstersia sp.]|uniref:helix-turn-helix transcriptional regulator n=1 Tax=Kerstersia sp. TaxID=1930783 RepID=UPI003F91ACF4
MTAHAVNLRRLADLGIDIVEARSRRHFARHIHDEFGIGLIMTGAQRSASGRGQVEALAGDLISVNPGEVHDGMPVGGEARCWHMLYFAPPLITGALADMAEGSGLRPQEFAYPALRNAQAAPLFRKLYQAVAHAAPGSERLALDETLPLLLSYLLDRPLPVAAARDTSAVRAKTMIDDAPHAHLSLAELAREADMSRFQLVRAFARLTGLTPHAYLVQRRIQRVRQLIASGMPLADAALACGFSDQSHMTRCFVSCFGFSPGLYARQARQARHRHHAFPA